MNFNAPIPWTPHKGQKLGVKFLLEHAAAALLADPGVGKTSMVLAAFAFLKKRKLANKMLVIAPLKPVWLVWPYEVLKWKDFFHLRVEVLHGPDKAEALERDADIYVINPDGLDWLLDAERKKNIRGRVSVTTDVKAFKALGFDTLVLDELTLWKHPGSGRHKALKTVLDTFSRRWGLTGTPVPNGLLDLFGQVYCLDMGRSFGPYITHFRREYFLPSFDGFGWNLQKGAEQRIYDRIKPLALRLDANDYIDMPALVENVIKFDLPTDAQRIYNELEEDLFTKLDTATITAANAASASTKCRQVASGGIYLNTPMSEAPTLVKKLGRLGKREVLHLHDEKTELVADLVEELQGSPLLVAYDFNHDLERLQKRFGKDVPYIGGGTSTARATELEGLWNAGKIPLLLGHPQSIGHGLNLQQAGNHVCWYSPTWNLELHDQFNGRVRRQGQKSNRVFVHYLLARDTVDEIIYWAIKAKNKTQTSLLAALKEKRRVAK
jgi:SNF2 family DNA or RNA helicase